MKQTREFTISDRVFAPEDFMRIAELFRGQKTAEGDRVTTSFEVIFGNNTRFESDTSDVFHDNLLTAHGRPTVVKMTYSSYSLDLGQSQRMYVSLNHGDSRYGNEVSVTGYDGAWVNSNFQALKDIIERARPQTSWARRHKALLLNLIAISLGTMVFWIIDLIVAWNEPWLGEHFPAPAQLVSLAKMPGIRGIVYALDILSRWFIGMLWGAGAIRRWLLEMWPSIEFDFGPPHLRIEKEKRTRLISVSVLIVLPLLTSFVYDLLKFTLLKKN